MKKLFLSIFICIIYSGGSIQAQPMSGMDVRNPGIQSMIIQFQDELNLTDEQKNELARLRLEQRRRVRVPMGPAPRMRPGPRDVTGFDRGMQGRMNQPPAPGRREGLNRGGQPDAEDIRQQRRMLQQDNSAEPDADAPGMLQHPLEILTEEQAETLVSLVEDRLEQQKEFRLLYYSNALSGAGIEGDKAAQILNLFEEQGDSQLALQLERLQNPDSANRDVARESLQSMTNLVDEMKDILTVSEYERLRGVLFTRQPRPGVRRSAIGPR